MVDAEKMADRILIRIRPYIVEAIRSETKDPDPLSDLTPEERGRVDRKAERMVRGKR